MMTGTVVFSKFAQSYSPQKMGRFVHFRNGEQHKISRDVPKGHCAVYVGEHRSRFIIPTSFLNHSLFADLLQKCADEFGFDHHLGVVLPCDDRLFEQLTSLLSTAFKKKNHTHSTPESLDLLLCELTKEEFKADKVVSEFQFGHSVKWNGLDWPRGCPQKHPAFNINAKS